VKYLHPCITSVTSGPVYVGTLGARGFDDGKVPDRASNGSTSYTHIKNKHIGKFLRHTISDDHTTKSHKDKLSMHTNLRTDFSSWRTHFHLHLQHKAKLLYY